MKQLIVENRLPVPIFVRVMAKEIKDEPLIILASLFFERPEGTTEDDTREVEIMQQFIVDLPEATSYTELDPGALAGNVDFEVYDDHETLFIRLKNLRQGSN